MLDWIKRRLAGGTGRNQDPFAELRKQVVAGNPLSCGLAEVDAFFNRPRNEIAGLRDVVQGRISGDEITDPVLQGLMRLSDPAMGRARAVGLFWSRRDKIGGFGSPDNRTGALIRIAAGRGTWTAAELTAILDTHRDVIGMYDFAQVLEILRNSARSGSAGDIRAPLARFLNTQPSFERFAGQNTLDALQGLAELAGITPEEIAPIQDHAKAQRDLPDRQKTLWEGCGPLMRHVLDETARYDGTSRAVNPHGAFRDALALQLDQLDAKDRTRLCLDIRRCQQALRDPAWKFANPATIEGINPAQIQSVSGAVLDLHRLEGMKLSFTHAEALEYLRLMFAGAHPRSGLRRVQNGLGKALIRAIEAPDADLAAQIRNSSLPTRDKDSFLAGLCPELAGKKSKDGSEAAGTPLQRDLVQTRDRIRANMARLRGLWITVEGGSGPEWTDFDHQLHPFHADVNRYARMILDAAELGVDIAGHRAVLMALVLRAGENMLKLDSGQYQAQTLAQVRAGLPEGETVSIKNIYWTRKAPARARDVFDAAGQPKPKLVLAIEAQFLEGLTRMIARIDAIEPSEPLIARLARILPTEAASKPTAAWKKQARAELEDAMLERLLAILDAYVPDGRRQYEVVAEALLNGTDALPKDAYSALQIKAMTWAAQFAPPEAAAPVLGDLALRCYRRVPGVGQANGKLGNAAVYALSQLPDTHGIKQMYRIRHRVVFSGVKTALDKALARLAEARGLSRVALDEMAVPDHGLVPGPLRLPIGPGAARIDAGSGTPVLAWEDAGGVLRKTVPKALSEADAEGVKAARARLKAIQQDMTEQKARLERMFRQEVSWDVATWSDNYRDHGTMAVLARQLLWQAETDGRRVVFLPCGEQCEDVEGNPVDLAGATIRLWHPLDSPQALRDAWRVRLMAKGIVQPMRQVWRETYALTEAERETATYSNRFAGHILRQHQLMALAGANGWQSTHRVGFDTPDDQPTHTRLPDFGLQAEYWTAAAGIDGPTTEQGAYLYLVTDRLKFHRLDAKARFGRGDEVPLAEVPPRVISEILRDCDLFTSVASISLDPEWQDKGRDAAHPSKWRAQADAYWNWSQGAALTASAETRKEMLALLLPRMKQRASLSIEGDYLHVQGKLHRYHIHLGSGAVRMAETLQHLCIVPDRGKQTRMTLPFDGDPILSLVLSKAMLLMADDKITDPVITRQMKARFR